MGREFQPAIPGQRGHQAHGQPLHVLRERLHDGLRILAGEPHQPHVARAPLD